MVSTLWFWGWFLVSGTFFSCHSSSRKIEESRSLTSFLYFGQRNGLLGLSLGCFLQTPKFFPESITYTNFLWPGSRRSFKKTWHIFFNTRPLLLQFWNDSWQNVKDRSQKTSCGSHLIKSGRVSCRSVSTPWPGSFMAQHSSWPQWILATLCLN